MKVEVIELVELGIAVASIEVGSESERWPKELFRGDKAKFEDFMVDGECSSESHLRHSIGDRAERERVRVRVRSASDELEDEDETVGVLEREVVRLAISE
jgi:hypothetical protein